MQTREEWQREERELNRRIAAATARRNEEARQRAVVTPATAVNAPLQVAQPTSYNLHAQPAVPASGLRNYLAAEKARFHAMMRQSPASAAAESQRKQAEAELARGRAIRRDQAVQADPFFGLDDDEPVTFSRDAVTLLTLTPPAVMRQWLKEVK